MQVWSVPGAKGRAGPAIWHKPSPLPAHLSGHCIHYSQTCLVPGPSVGPLLFPHPQRWLWMSQNSVRLWSCRMRYLATGWLRWPWAEDCLLTLNVCKSTERTPRAVAGLAHIIAFCRLVDLGNQTKHGSLVICFCEEYSWLLRTQKQADGVGTSSCRTNTQCFQRFGEGLALSSRRW